MRIGPLIFGLLDEATPIELTAVSLSFANLPRGFDGFRLAVLTDLHFGRFVQASFVRRALRLLAGQQPHMLLMCGDLVDRPRHFTNELAEMLGEICGHIPNYCVLGNHDRYSGAGDFCRIFRAAGVDVLVNEHRLIRRGGGEERIALVGLDDGKHGQADAQAATAGIAEGTFTILAAHDPDAADRLPDGCRPDVMFAGHTHGGQVRIFGRPLAKETRNKDYVIGLVKGPGFPMYVSRGLGVTGVPVRFGSMPELPIVTLRSIAEK